MIVPIIYEKEVYTKEKPTYLWVFYKFVRFCLDSNNPIIATEEYFKEPSYYKKKRHSAVNVMDYYGISDEDIQNVKCYKITKEEEQKILNKYSGNLEDIWLSLLKKRNKELEKVLEKAISELETKTEKVDAFIVWTWIPSIEYVAKKHNIKIINMEGSFIRQPFYNELLTYFQFQNKYSSEGLVDKYNELISSNNILYFTNEEIFSLFAADNNLKYLLDFNKCPEYDIGYCTGLKTDCFEKIYSKVSQKEIIDYLAKLADTQKVIIRPHPLEPIEVSNNNIIEDKSASTFEWLLKCNKIICNLSNVGCEALLLNNRLQSLSDLMPSSFGEIGTYDLKEGERVDKRRINFLVFYWFAPEKLTQDSSYVEWRLTNPSVVEIYNRHMNFILEERGLSLDEMKKLSLYKRLERILSCRNLPKNEVDKYVKTIKISNYVDINNFNATIYDYRKVILELIKSLYEKDSIIEQNKTTEEERDFYKKELNNVLNSSSWKLTSPLRKISSLKSNIIKKQDIEEQLNVENLKEDNSYKKYKPYISKYQDNIDFSDKKTDLKVIAFYLPQYHTFKENDEWWGKGFTEWTNTKKSKPRFEEHYQPRVPHKDIGYYKLDNINTIKKQIQLAKQHGIYGFCFYYYWFSGKRLMEKPIDLFLNDKKIDFPFCLCWANENWTRTWDGLENDILIKQNYTKQDYKNFIKDIKKYVEDKRYIRVDNKPMIMVYNPKEIPNFDEQVKEWRKYAIEEGIGEIYICSKCDLADDNHEFADYVDAEFDFPPQGIGHKETLITGLPSPKIFNYKKIVDDIEHLYKEHFPTRPFYYSCTMGWDNSARRDDNYTVYYNYSLESFYKWLRIIIKETRRRNSSDKRFMFINAWNEWAEGAYLEPDEKYQYAYLEALREAIVTAGETK